VYLVRILANEIIKESEMRSSDLQGTVRITMAALAVLLISVVAFAVAVADPDAEVIAAGERLVHNMDCNVCHSPKVFGPQGPQVDTSRLLSGHRGDETIAPIPEGALGPTGWGGLFSNGMTAWAGPWGVSFGSNLTPDTKTGIGDWTAETFIESMRTGTHVDQGRPFLPPMPTYSQLNDEELHAIFAYLQSVPPVENEVPGPIPPSRSMPEEKR